ncbi:hypothetical protein AQUCO_00400250v1 [Aquilegia coerulea]|uniref:Uncharacterized protein n=1 Tax=Aquilegia coerulea TaxID=218851 RepID=A0A2G5EU09_AQUCA|nr:hypothetical protein AQUCO_00400250v1 [Aquilegia coerulea]
MSSPPPYSITPLLTAGYTTSFLVKPAFSMSTHHPLECSSFHTSTSFELPDPFSGGSTTFIGITQPPPPSFLFPSRQLNKYWARVFKPSP